MYNDIANLIQFNMTNLEQRKMTLIQDKIERAKNLRLEAVFIKTALNCMFFAVVCYKPPRIVAFSNGFSQNRHEMYSIYGGFINRCHKHREYYIWWRFCINRHEKLIVKCMFSCND